MANRLIEKEKGRQMFALGEENRNKMPYKEALMVPGLIVMGIAVFFMKLSAFQVYFWYPTYL